MDVVLSLLGIFTGILIITSVALWRYGAYHRALMQSGHPQQVTWRHLRNLPLE